MAAVIGVGLVALLATIPLPGGSREVIAVAVVALAAGVGWRSVWLAGTWAADKGPRPEWRARLAALREAALTFSPGIRRGCGACS